MAGCSNDCDFSNDQSQSPTSPPSSPPSLVQLPGWLGFIPDEALEVALVPFAGKWAFLGIPITSGVGLVLLLLCCACVRLCCERRSARRREKAQAAHAAMTEAQAAAALASASKTDPLANVRPSPNDRASQGASGHGGADTSGAAPPLLSSPECRVSSGGDARSSRYSGSCRDSKGMGPVPRPPKRLSILGLGGRASSGGSSLGEPSSLPPLARDSMKEKLAMLPPPPGMATARETCAAHQPLSGGLLGAARPPPSLGLSLSRISSSASSSARNSSPRAAAGKRNTAAAADDDDDGNDGCGDCGACGGGGGVAAPGSGRLCLLTSGGTSDCVGSSALLPSDDPSATQAGGDGAADGGGGVEASLAEDSLQAHGVLDKAGRTARRKQEMRAGDSVEDMVSAKERAPRQTRRAQRGGGDRSGNGVNAPPTLSGGGLGPVPSCSGPGRRMSGLGVGMGMLARLSERRRSSLLVRPSDKVEASAHKTHMAHRDSLSRDEANLLSKADRVAMRKAELRGGDSVDDMVAPKERAPRQARKPAATKARSVEEVAVVQAAPALAGSMPIAEWLETSGLGGVVECFAGSGLETLTELKGLSASDLRDLGIEPKDRAALMQKLRRVTLETVTC